MSAAGEHHEQSSLERESRLLAECFKDRNEKLLLDFLADRDVDCMACGYNLRNITRSVCPECGAALELKVGLQNVRLGWLLAAIAPGLASGLLATILLIVMIIHPDAPPEVIIIDILGFAGGAVSIALLLYRWRFMRASASSRFMILAAIWAVHLAMYGWFIMWIF